MLIKIAKKKVNVVDTIIEEEEGDHIKIDIGQESPSKPLRKGSDRSNLNGFLSLKKKISRPTTKHNTPGYDKYDIEKLLNPSIFLSSDQIIEKKINKNWQRKRSKILSCSRLKIAPKASQSSRSPPIKIKNKKFTSIEDNNEMNKKSIFST